MSQLSIYDMMKDHKKRMEFRILKVLRVVDGDTVDCHIDLGFDLFIKRRVRLFGINAPESRTLDLEEKQRGLAAKARLKTMLEEGNLGLVSLKKGKFGRTVGLIVKDGDYQHSINQQLVDEGHAAIKIY